MRYHSSRIFSINIFEDSLYSINFQRERSNKYKKVLNNFPFFISRYNFIFSENSSLHDKIYIKNDCLTFWSLRFTLCTASFNIQKFCVLPAIQLLVCVVLRTNSDYFSIQQFLIGFRTKAESVFCPVRTGSLNQTQFHPFRVKYNLLKIIIFFKTDISFTWKLIILIVIFKFSSFVFIFNWLIKSFCFKIWKCCS